MFICDIKGNIDKRIPSCDHVNWILIIPGSSSTEKKMGLLLKQVFTELISLLFFNVSDITIVKLLSKSN